MNVDEPVGVEVRDLAVNPRELVGLRVGRVEQLGRCRRRRGREQRVEIPDDVGGGEVGRSHAAGSYCDHVRADLCITSRRAVKPARSKKFLA